MYDLFHLKTGGAKMINLILLIQILSFFFIFQSVSRYHFTIKELTAWLSIFILIGFVSTYFIGVWGAITLFFCFVGISYFKNHRMFTALGIFLRNLCLGNELV
jgi:two-component system sensor histidine kinase AgrC